MDKRQSDKLESRGCTCTEKALIVHVVPLDINLYYYVEKIIQGYTNKKLVIALVDSLLYLCGPSLSL